MPEAPNIADCITRGDIALIINAPLGRAALHYNVPCVTIMTAVAAIAAKLTEEAVQVRSLQEIHAEQEPARMV